MRSNVLLLAIGLLVADSTLAGPCKPRSSTSEIAISTSTASTTQPTTTAEESSTVSLSETSVETGTTITTAPDTTTASQVETTTTAELTTTTAETESTTTTAVATPTFAIVGGGGAIQGAPLKGVDGDGTMLLFNPQVAGNSRTRIIILDPNTGRLRDQDTGVQICAYYGSSETTSDPANIAFCQNDNTGPNTTYDYLTCQIVSGSLSCTAPQAACPTDENGLLIGCVTSDGQVNNQFYYKTRAGAGTYLYISSGSPSGYTPVNIIAQET